jgi:hypothetical protein
MLILPLFGAVSGYRKSTVASPFNTVAIAGHSTPSGWCECGCPGCICDPGEVPTCNNGLVVEPSQNNSDPVSAAPEEDTDMSEGLMLIAVLFFLWARFRA